MFENDLNTFFILQRLLGDIQDQYPPGGERPKPLVQERVEQGRVLRFGDVDAVTPGQAAGNRSLIRAQADDQLRERLRFTDVGVQPPAQVIFGVREQAAAVKEAGKSVEVEIESPIHQPDL